MYVTFTTTTTTATTTTATITTMCFFIILRRSPACVIVLVTLYKPMLFAVKCCFSCSGKISYLAQVKIKCNSSK